MEKKEEEENKEGGWKNTSLRCWFFLRKILAWFASIYKKLEVTTRPYNYKATHTEKSTTLLRSPRELRS